MKPWMIILIAAAAGLAGYWLHRPGKVWVSVANNEPLEPETIQTGLQKEIDRVEKQFNEGIKIGHVDLESAFIPALDNAYGALKSGNFIKMSHAYWKLKAIV